ncbi:MAG: hypothetical protein AAF628_07740 [Planctomycetota bacterium]
MNRLAFSDGSAFRNSFSQVFASPATAAGYGTWGHIMAHEVLHSYNGSGGLVPERQEEWSKEGFTDYLAAVHLVRAGLTDVATFAARVASAGRSYEARTRGISIRDAGADKFTHRGLVYGGGLLAALMLDVDMRTATGERVGVSELLGALYGDSPSRRYDLDDVVDAVARLASDEAASRLRDRITGVDTLDWRRAVRALGLDPAEPPGDGDQARRLRAAILE